MKKSIIFLLLAALVLSFTGCSAENSSGVSEAASMGTAFFSEAVPETTVQETTAPPVYTGQIYLTVSERTFLVAGEREDIYCGSLPRDVITWTSADASVAIVEDGVVTAVGVGTTTVTAQYGDQKMECTIGCLAKTPEELEGLSQEVMHSPKKLPPVSDGQPCTFFDDAVIVGDSVSYSLFLWAAQTGEMSNATFLVKGGTGINGYIHNQCQIDFQGAEHSLQDAIALSGAKKMFIMMGVNDLGFLSVEQTIENFEILMDLILEKSPDLEVYIQSCLPVWDAGIQGAKNSTVNAFNQALILYAQEHNFHYVEVASYVTDHTGQMAERYCSDFTTHMNYDGTDAWMQALKLYALTQTMEEN